MRIKIPFFELELSEKDIDYIARSYVHDINNKNLSDYLLSVPILMVNKLTTSISSWFMNNVFWISMLGLASSYTLRFFIGLYIAENYLWVLGILNTLVVLFAVMFVGSVIAYVTYFITRRVIFTFKHLFYKKREDNK